ncbi:uncharacterized protein LOC129600266 isoform X2 [Paramacrobiotus metropolitanus]|uniref:uncharacterized protein LOC129600266 isoform X2 n=1 Tax=Paramacrobiotus metropolitanus TaxID=2943436 RepID=UPI0024456D39|nr:uncharacterized protein LOC129600266 isoform X2 [Paramacrobiotus metropolitanus]
MAGSGVLTLVFDTNVLLKPDGLELFQEIAGEQYGTLPASVGLMVSHIVLMELQYHSGENPETIRAARAAYLYLTQPGLPARVRVQSQYYSQQLEAAFYPDNGRYRPRSYGSKNDGLVLLSCLELYYSAAGDVWLVSNDQQLGARCVRSGLLCLSLQGLKAARALLHYNIRHPLGNDYHTWRGEGPEVKRPACQPLQACIAFPGVLRNVSKTGHFHRKLHDHFTHARQV